MPRRPITSAHPYTPGRGPLAGQTFTSERQYRNALAAVHGRPSLYRQQHPLMAAGWRPQRTLILVRGTLPGDYRFESRAPASRRDAHLLGEYWNAVGHYLRAGDKPLRRFRDVVIHTKDGGRLRLVTDRDLLRELGQAGELDFDDIYQDVA